MKHHHIKGKRQNATLLVKGKDCIDHVNKTPHNMKSVLQYSLNIHLSMHIFTKEINLFDLFDILMLNKIYV